jgi:hypothetical protein
MLAWFSFYLRWYVPRHFHALRLAHAARFLDGADSDAPVIVALNHPSWWDPLTCILTSRFLLPRHFHYAPMDAAEVSRYRILAHMGLFPVDKGSPRGAAQFLRAAQEILSRPRSLLWVTPQGEFTDARQRPVVFRPGLSALVARLPRATVIPLAIEYTYWNQRLPEILVNAGMPQHFRGQANSDAIDAQLTAALAATQDELAALAHLRDASLFDTVLQGADGTGNLYGPWQRLRATGRPRVYRRPTEGENTP